MKLMSSTALSFQRAMRAGGALVFFVLGLVSIQAAAINNVSSNSCLTAIVLQPGIPALVNTTNATYEADPTSSCGFLGRSIWFTFTPTNTGAVLVRTCYSDFDTVIEVYTGNCSALVPVPGGCVDDDGPACSGLQASVIVDTTAGVPLYILAGGYGAEYGTLTLSIEPVPRLAIKRAGANQAELSWLGAPGSWYQILTASNLNPSAVGSLQDAWQPPSSNPPLRLGTTNALTQTIRTTNGLGFSQLRLEGRVYGVADVMVSDDPATSPTNYSGLAIRRVTKPFVPGEVGTPGIAQNVNEGIEGTDTRIWVRYAELGAALQAGQRVLTDIAVAHWPDWNNACPDPERHSLSGTNQCSGGWQLASGTSSGIQGALTTGTKRACGRMGLCVRYRPVSDIASNNVLFIEQLSVSVSDKDEVVYPPGVVGWQADSVNIQQGCREVVPGTTLIPSISWYITYARRTILPPLAFSPEQKLDLLTRYAPLIWLPEDEPFKPASVDWAFQYLERYLNPDGQWWLRTKQPIKFDIKADVEFLGTLGIGGSLVEDNAFYHGDLDTAPVYAFWVEKDGPSVVDLVYYHYFPWNDGKNQFGRYYGHHIGDFEHVTVRLIDGQPSAIYFSAHSFGRTFEWSRIAKSNDTHPIVYTAKGSHGMWRTSGDNVYDNSNLLGLITLADECSAGTAWQTWLKVEAHDFTRRTGLSGRPWPVWMNTDYSNPGTGDPTIPGQGPIWRWGNEEEGWKDPTGAAALLENGPTGPVHKGVWNRFIFE